MAAQRTKSTVVFFTAAIVFLGLVALLFFAWPSFIDPGDDIGRAELERQDSLALDDGSMPEKLDQQINTDDEVQHLAGIPTDLLLAEHRVDRGSGTLEGVVVNNTGASVVNVQVGFDLLDADGTRVGGVRDTTSEVDPGGSWQFAIPLPPDVTFTSARVTEVQGFAREVEGLQEEPQPLDNREPDYEPS